MIDNVNVMPCRGTTSQPCLTHHHVAVHLMGCGGPDTVHHHSMVNTSSSSPSRLQGHHQHGSVFCIATSILRTAVWGIPAVTKGRSCPVHQQASPVHGPDPELQSRRTQFGSIEWGSGAQQSSGDAKCRVERLGPQFASYHARCNGPPCRWTVLRPFSGYGRYPAPVCSCTLLNTPGAVPPLRDASPEALIAWGKQPRRSHLMAAATSLARSLFLSLETGLQAVPAVSVPREALNLWAPAHSSQPAALTRHTCPCLAAKPPRMLPIHAGNKTDHTNKTRRLFSPDAGVLKAGVALPALPEDSGSWRTPRTKPIHRPTGGGRASKDSRTMDAMFSACKGGLSNISGGRDEGDQQAAQRWAAASMVFILIGGAIGAAPFRANPARHVLGGTVASPLAVSARCCATACMLQPADRRRHYMCDGGACGLYVLRSGSMNEHTHTGRTPAVKQGCPCCWCPRKACRRQRLW